MLPLDKPPVASYPRIMVAGQKDEDSEILHDEIENDAEQQSPTGVLVPGRPLSPRHRRLAELIAQGMTNQQISDSLGYVGSRISVLRREPSIAAEVERLQERLFEETVQKRLRDFAEPALNNIHMILTDQSNRVKISEKADMSKWVIEKIDGKASQKVDVGENLLSVLMDKMEYMRSQGNPQTSPHPSNGEAIDVTPAQIQAPVPKTEESLLADWVVSYEAETKK